MNDDTTDVAPEPEPAAPATPDIPDAAQTFSVARLRTASDHQPWTIDGAAVANGWTSDTLLTKQEFNTAVEEWLNRPVKAEGATDDQDTDDQDTDDQDNEENA